MYLTISGHDRCRRIILHRGIRSSTIHLDICDFFNIPFAQFGASIFSKFISCMHEGECSTSSPSQFKPSFFISQCGRIYRYADIHVYSTARTKQNLSASFQILNSFVIDMNNLREIPCPKKPRKRRIIIDSGSD